MLGHFRTLILALESSWFYNLSTSWFKSHIWYGGHIISDAHANTVSEVLLRLLGRKHLLGPVWFYKSSLSHFLVSYHTELVERRYWSGTMAPHSIAWHDHLLRSSHRVPAKMTGVSGACVRHRRCWRREHALRCSTAEASPKVKKKNE